MVEFHEDNFEQKLLLLKDTQDSIQSLSLWCLKHQSHHKKIVSCWLHVLKKVKVEQRVTLFYLANDVIQYSKRKGYPFVESWATALQKGTPLVRDDKIKHKILRLFKIWGERNIYDDTFLTDLSGLLTAHTKKSNQSTADLIHEFQPSSLFSKIRKCKALEEDTDLKMKLMKECNIPVSDPDAMQIAIKDRRNGDDLMQDIEDGIQKLEAYTKALELEIKERIEVINVLEVSEQFYDTQRGEAKVVCNAYRNFGNRVKTLKRKLEELLPTLPSPIPSPDVNAPSPSSGSDIDIPEDKSVRYDSEKSFIGTDFVNTMNNVGEVHHESMQNTFEHIESNNINYNMHPQSNYNDYMHSGVTLVSSPAGYYRNNSQHKLESPRHHLDDSMTYAFQRQSEGNRIEVINSNNADSHGGYGVIGFSVAATSTPMPSSKIPGLESPTDNAREVFSFIESKVKVTDDNETAPIMWGDKPLTKYQSWPSPDITWNNSQETPVSPPVFEQESYANPAIEYVDTNVAPADEVDHRLTAVRTAKGKGDFERLATIPLPKHDIDDRVAFESRVSPNRNLISLTESPSTNDTVWKNTSDSDYRAIPMPPTPPVMLSNVDTSRTLTKAPLDNIESVDMEMSDDESDKGDERGVKHRRSSLKDEGSSPYKNRSHQQLLQPPPNPWEVVNVANDEPDRTGNGMMGDFIEHPPLPPQFPSPCFPMPLPHDQNIRFRPPPPMMMPPPPPPQNNHSNALFHPPPPPPPLMNLQSFGQPPFRPSVPFLVTSPDANSNRTASETVPSDNVNTIEPLVQSRQPENAPDFANKAVRSNLKQISLSDVLEKTMREADRNVEAENGDEDITLSGGIHDHLFDDDVSGIEGNENDDGDDLYNDIDVRTTDPAENGTNNENPQDGESNSKPTPTKRAPFQAVVPKLAKPPMAPAMLTDDDPRSSWALTPIIDLSNDLNSLEDDRSEGDGGGGGDSSWSFVRMNEPRNFGFNQHSGNEFQARIFNNDGGDRRFPISVQNSPPNRFRGGGDAMNRGRGRFLSPRGDFRLRSSAPPPFTNQRMPFRSPNTLTVRGNFQNSPRIFRGRSPGRPFRRGW